MVVSLVSIQLLLKQLGKFDIPLKLTASQHVKKHFNLQQNVSPTMTTKLKPKTHKTVHFAVEKLFKNKQKSIILEIRGKAQYESAWHCKSDLENI